jgi:hypothetical protein
VGECPARQGRFQVTLARVLNGPAFWLQLKFWTTAPAHLKRGLGEETVEMIRS